MCFFTATAGGLSALALLVGEAFIQGAMGGDTASRSTTRRLLAPLWATSGMDGAPMLAARVQLLEAAAVAFMRGGYAGTTLEDVARENTVSRGQIYHYYRSKADLYFDVVVAAFLMIEVRVAPVAARVEVPVTQRLHEMAHAHAMVMMTRLSFQKVALDAVQHRLHPDTSLRCHQASGRIVQLRRAYQDMLRRTIAEGVADGAFAVPSVRLATRAMLGALNWLTVWFDPQRSATAADLEAIATLTADFALSGLQRDAVAFDCFAARAREDARALISEARISEGC